MVLTDPHTDLELTPILAPSANGLQQLTQRKKTRPDSHDQLADRFCIHPSGARGGRTTFACSDILHIQVQQFRSKRPGRLVDLFGVDAVTEQHQIHIDTRG